MTSSISKIAAEPADLSALKIRFEGLEEIFPIALESLKKDIVIRIDEIKAGLKTQDARAVQLAAHSIKGMVSEFHAEPTRALSEQIEQLAKGGQLNGCDLIFETLASELKRLEDFLVALNPATF